MLCLRLDRKRAQAQGLKPARSYCKHWRNPRSKIAITSNREAYRPRKPIWFSESLSLDFQRGRQLQLGCEFRLLSFMITMAVRRSTSPRPFKCHGVSRCDAIEPIGDSRRKRPPVLSEIYDGYILPSEIRDGIYEFPQIL
jgi:hypothetical protein